MTTPEGEEGRLTIREARAAKLAEESRETAARKTADEAHKKEPVTWPELVIPSFMTIGCGVAPFLVLQYSAMVEESPNGTLALIALFVLTFVGAACTTVMHVKGLWLGWSIERAERASVRLSCSLIALPTMIFAGAWVLRSVRAYVGATDTPGWALVMIVLLVLILLKK